MKKGILVASFGTTYQETRKKNIDCLVADVKKQFPEIPVFEAYTSPTVRRKIYEKEELKKYSVQEALEQMAAQEISHAVILPTHVIDGIESNRLKDTVATRKVLFDEIKTASVLLKREQDYELVCQSVWEELREQVGDATLILMGHGTEHEADESYRRAEKVFQEYSHRNIFIGSVEGRVRIEAVIEKLKEIDAGKKVVLAPFMLVAGDHAMNDMAGETDSFRSKLKEQGYEVECLMKGLGEYQGVRNVYLKHLKEAL